MDNAFVIHNPYVTIDDYDAQYVLFGIQVADRERIARVNYVRRNADSNVDDVVGIADDFNVTLYNHMYPDARFYSKAEAYADYQNKWTQNDYRISKAPDILNTRTPVFALTAMSVTENMQISGNLSWNGINLSNVSTDYTRPHRSSPLDTSLITEYAIKRYVDSPYETQAEFVDLRVSSNARLGGTEQQGVVLVTPSNVVVDGETTFRSRICIGPPLQ